MQRISWLFITFWLLTLACVPLRPVSTPTPPFQLPTIVSSVATLTPTHTATPTPELTATPLVSNTITPTVTFPPTVTPQPTVVRELNITSPVAGARWSQGQTVTVEGWAVVDPADRLEVGLFSLSDTVLGGNIVPVNAQNRWKISFPIPNLIGGLGVVRVSLFSAGGELLRQDAVVVYVQANVEDTRFLEVARPLPNQTAVAGYNFYFDGQMKNPANFLITVAIRDESCLVPYREQRFGVRGTGYWQGYIQIPADVVGPACAVAYFGRPGQDNWREVQYPITVLAPDDPAAYGIYLINDPAGQIFGGGESWLLNGLAYRAPYDEIFVSLELDNGAILVSQIAEVDELGYWELPIIIPVQTEGQALLRLILRDRARVYAEVKTVITLEPEG